VVGLEQLRLIESNLKNSGGYLPATTDHGAAACYSLAQPARTPVRATQILNAAGQRDNLIRFDN
jgi:hypothetical protein